MIYNLELKLKVNKDDSVSVVVFGCICVVPVFEDSGWTLLQNALHLGLKPERLRDAVPTCVGVYPADKGESGATRQRSPLRLPDDPGQSQYQALLNKSPQYVHHTSSLSKDDQGLHEQLTKLQ